MPAIAVQALTPVDEPRALEIAQSLQLPLLHPTDNLTRLPDIKAVLRVSGRHLSLCQTGRQAPGPVEVDFGGGRMRHRRRSGNNELLGRAVGVGKRDSLHVLDATAGLGRDAFVLADLGCDVRLCERHPVIAALLEAGIARAQNSDEAWLSAAAGRLSLVSGDARDCGLPPGARADVIYLDPMFPPRGKSAAVKKDMALFQLLLGDGLDTGDAAQLLHWACSQPVARVVVKRPLRAGTLGESKPSHCIRGKSVRYDVHVLGRLD